MLFLSIIPAFHVIVTDFHRDSWSESGLLFFVSGSDFLLGRVDSTAIHDTCLVLRCPFSFRRSHRILLGRFLSQVKFKFTCLQLRCPYSIRRSQNIFHVLAILSQVCVLTLEACR